MTAQALINPFSTAPFPGERYTCVCLCVCVCTQGQVHDPGVTVNHSYIAVCHKSLAGALYFPVYLVTPWCFA